MISLTYLQPKPVVDTITKESEKYGNQGDQLQGIQKIVVGVMSVVSNAINALLDVSLNFYLIA